MSVSYKEVVKSKEALEPERVRDSPKQKARALVRIMSMQDTVRLLGSAIPNAATRNQISSGLTTAVRDICHDILAVYGDDK